MLDNEYIDLETRDNKVNFAITNYLSESGIPVITGNFKNSYLDIQTTTHEFGHAYQKYNAGIKDKHYIVSSLLKYPTFDIAEMFSYAMELICMNYVDNLFNEEDYKKYCFMKIYNSVNTLPYICLVDEFQEKIYSIKNLEKENIRKIWLELSEKYGLEQNNQGHLNLDSGGYFYRQSHIMLEPFYYIDYALSYFGAFAIADACANDLKLYKEIGAVASYFPLNKLIKEYNLPNPFDEETVKNISKMLESKLLKYKNELVNGTLTEEVKNMITIGIDIDDTLVETNKKALEIILREGYASVEYYEKLPKLSEFINKHFVEIVKTVSLFEGSKETIQKLKNMGYRIVLISSRAFQEGADTEEDTINYLENNNIQYDKVLLKRPNKVDACIQEHVDYFIDDKEKTLDTLSEIGVKCIKMQSIDKEPSKYIPVNNWSEILSIFQEL